MPCAKSGEEIECGFKEKGTTTHLLVDRNGSPVALTSTAAKWGRALTSRAIARQSAREDDECAGTAWNDSYF